jgi:hypothetical protein
LKSGHDLFQFDQRPAVVSASQGNEALDPLPADQQTFTQQGRINLRQFVAGFGHGTETGLGQRHIDLASWIVRRGFQAMPRHWKKSSNAARGFGGK